MPLLVLKLYALINNPEHDLLLGSVDANALCATLMILLGAYSRLGLDELYDYKGMSRTGFMVGILAYLCSVALLVLLLVDLVRCFDWIQLRDIWRWGCYHGFPENMLRLVLVTYSLSKIYQKSIDNDLNL